MPEDLLGKGFYRANRRKPQKNTLLLLGEITVKAVSLTLVRYVNRKGMSPADGTLRPGCYFSVTM